MWKSGKILDQCENLTLPVIKNILEIDSFRKCISLKQRY